MEDRIAVIGAGIIGGAIVKSLKKSGYSDKIIATDIQPKRLKELEKLGYVCKGEYGITGRRFFLKGKEVITYHLHIYEEGSPEIQRHINVVEFLTEHPAMAKEYETLKIELARKYKLSPKEYSDGKSEFIKKVEIEAEEWKSS